MGDSESKNFETDPSSFLRAVINYNQRAEQVNGYFEGTMVDNPQQRQCDPHTNVNDATNSSGACFDTLQDAGGPVGPTWPSWPRPHYVLTFDSYLQQLEPVLEDAGLWKVGPFGNIAISVTPCIHAFQNKIKLTSISINPVFDTRFMPYFTWTGRVFPACLRSL